MSHKTYLMNVRDLRKLSPILDVMFIDVEF